MSSPDDWAEPLIKYGPSLSSEDQNSVADASLENYSYAEPGMGSSFTPATQSDTRAALLGVLDPNYHLLETEETDTTYKKSSAPQPPHGDIVTLVEPGPDVYVNKEPPAKSTFQIDQKADTVVSPFNKPTTPRSFSAAPKLKTQSFISAWQKRGTLEICQPSTSGIQQGFTCEGNTVKVSQQLEVGSGAGGAPTPPHPNGGTRKRASGNGGSKAFQELNELQAAKE